MAEVTGAPDEGFVAQVVSALKCLYDFPSLLQHPLARLLAPASLSPERRGSFLRTSLMEAIGSLKPSPKAPPYSLPPRLHQALRLRYVEGCTVAEVAREMAVSERQAHRYIRQAETEVATVLWARHRQEAAELSQSRRESLGQEVERLPLSPTDVALAEVLNQAADTLAPLYKEEGTSLDIAPMANLTVRADAAGLRQCLIALLSYAAQCSRRVAVEAKPEGDEIWLRIECVPDLDTDSQALGQLLATGRALAEAVGAELQARTWEGKSQLWLRLPGGASCVILVIDDNEGLVDLFERYLSYTGYRVVGASNGEEGLRLAQQSRPAAIVLDILMPGTDGWALLTRLKRDPTTAAVPVIVCSVFNDPHLAQTLGAAAFVAKPVSQADLLGTLASLHLA
ncbi:MAG: response regulator [Anaerolineae bacterium]